MREYRKGVNSWPIVYHVPYASIHLIINPKIVTEHVQAFSNSVTTMYITLSLYVLCHIEMIQSIGNVHRLYAINTTWSLVKGPESKDFSIFGGPEAHPSPSQELRTSMICLLLLNMASILALGKQRQEDHCELKAIQGYIMRPCVKGKKVNNTQESIFAIDSVKLVLSAQT